jgi:DDE superfamily endonuclease
MGMSSTFGCGSLGLSGLVLAVLERLAYSERYAEEQGKRHKTLVDWAGQLLLLVRRWYPEREIVAVADGGYAALKLLDRCRRLSEPITFITCLRLDAALYEPAPPRHSDQIGRPRLKGDRLPNLSVLAQDPTTDWAPITLNNWYANSKRIIEIVSGMVPLAAASHSEDDSVQSGALVYARTTGALWWVVFGEHRFDDLPQLIWGAPDGGERLLLG